MEAFLAVAEIIARAAFHLAGSQAQLGPPARLSWDDVNFDEGVIRVRHSLKRGRGGKPCLALEDLKTESSNRTVAMPARSRAALAALRREQAADRLRLGQHYGGLARCSATRLAGRWAVSRSTSSSRASPRPPGSAGTGSRHTFVSVLSDAGVSIEDIADAVGHVNSNVTKVVYRHQIADTITRTSATMDKIDLASGSKG